MSDEYVVLEPEEKPRHERRIWRPLAVACWLALIVLIILMFKGCGDSDGSKRMKAGNRTIEAVEQGTPVDGLVSLWIKTDSLEVVLGSAAVDANDAIDMGNGRWVLEVPVGEEDRAIDALKNTPGVNDAGRVYQ